MLRIINKITILFIAFAIPLLFQGCISYKRKNNVMPQHVIDSVKNNEKCMIIFKTNMYIKNGSSAPSGTRDVLGVVSSWNSIDMTYVTDMTDILYITKGIERNNNKKITFGGEKIELDIRNHDVYDLPMCGYSAMVMDDGIYILSKIKYKYQPYGSSGTMTSGIYAPMIAGFIATAGKITYVGELNINQSYKGSEEVFKFSVKDDFDRCFVNSENKLPYLQDGHVFNMLIRV